MVKKSLIPTSKAKTAYGLLSEIATLALKEPKRIAMNVVFVRGKALSEASSDYRANVKNIAPSPCGTVGCIAGWALVLMGEAGRDQVNIGDTSKAAHLLGLSLAEEEDLFFPPLIHRKNIQTAEHAADVAAHIRAFQKRHASRLKAKRV